MKKIVTVLIITAVILIFWFGLYIITFNVFSERACDASIAQIGIKTINGIKYTVVKECISFSGPLPREWFSDLYSNHPIMVDSVLILLSPIIYVDTRCRGTKRIKYLEL